MIPITGSENSGELSEQIAALIPEYAIPETEYILANSLAELRSFNERSAPSAAGELPRIGLRIIPDAFDEASLAGIRVSELNAPAPEVRTVSAVSNTNSVFPRSGKRGLKSPIRRDIPATRISALILL